MILTTNRTLNEKGDLIDPDNNKTVLLHGRDTILNKKMEGEDFEDQTITLWRIYYGVKKVLKLRKNTIDWDALFEDDGE